MKLKNLTNKLITVGGVNILPGETQNVPDALCKGNGVVDFFLKTSRLAAVADRSANQNKGKNGKPGKQEPPASSTSPENEGGNEEDRGNNGEPEQKPGDGSQE